MCRCQGQNPPNIQLVVQFTQNCVCRGFERRESFRSTQWSPLSVDYYHRQWTLDSTAATYRPLLPSWSKLLLCFYHSRKRMLFPLHLSHSGSHLNYSLSLFPSLVTAHAALSQGWESSKPLPTTALLLCHTEIPLGPTMAVKPLLGAHHSWISTTFRSSGASVPTPAVEQIYKPFPSSLQTPCELVGVWINSQMSQTSQSCKQKLYPGFWLWKLKTQTQITCGGGLKENLKVRNWFQLSRFQSSVSFDTYHLFQLVHAMPHPCYGVFRNINSTVPWEGAHLACLAPCVPAAAWHGLKHSVYFSRGAQFPTLGWAGKVSKTGSAASHIPY